MAFLETANEGIFKLPLLLSVQYASLKMAKQMFPRDGTFVPILVHICFTKPTRKLRSKASSSAGYSQPPSSTGIIHIGVNHTIETMKESIVTLLGMDTFGVDKIREDGNWLDVGEVQWNFAVHWESQGVPNTKLVTDVDLERGLELLEMRGWKGHIVASCSKEGADE